VDLLVAGIPKTGTSALVYLLANSFTDSCVVFEPKNMHKYRKRIRRQRRRAFARRMRACAFNQIVRPCKSKHLAKVLYTSKDSRTLRELFREFSGFEKRIWIARDPRDQMVSCFLYAWYSKHNRPKSAFKSALELVRRKERGERIPLISIMRETLEPGYFHNPNYYGDRVPCYFRTPHTNLLIFPYEDLIHQRYEPLEDFLQAPITGSAEVPHSLRRVVRTGRSGNWRAWFEPEDVNYFRPLMREYMEQMKIDDDWGLSDQPVDSSLNSEYMLKLFHREI